MSAALDRVNSAWLVWTAQSLMVNAARVQMARNEPGAWERAEAARIASDRMLADYDVARKNFEAILKEGRDAAQL